MAKPLIVQLAGTDLPLHIEKVDRAKLYGYIDVEALDDKGRKCELATLCGDGRTLVGRSGSAIAYLSPSGEWRDKGVLKPIGRDDQPVTPVPSSFNAPIPLKDTATIEDYFAHNIRSVYQITSEADISALATELKKGTIFRFPFSYRGGLEPDTAFLLLGADGNVFMLLGKPTKIEFLGFEQAAPLTEDEGPEDESEEMDFSMM